jgi:hypothetical protein
VLGETLARTSMPCDDRRSRKVDNGGCSALACRMAARTWTIRSGVSRMRAHGAGDPGSMPPAPSRSAAARSRASKAAASRARRVSAVQGLGAGAGSPTDRSGEGRPGPRAVPPSAWSASRKAKASRSRARSRSAAPSVSSACDVDGVVSAADRIGSEGASLGCRYFSQASLTRSSSGLRRPASTRS